MPPNFVGMNLTRVFHTPLIRRPLFWMVALEALLLVGLAGVAWHVWQSRQEAASASPDPFSRQLPPAAGLGPARLPQPSAVPRASPAHPSPAAPTPGFRLDADFLARQFGDVNRDQARLEGIEWRLVKAAMQGMKSYLERVVLPRVERAEGRSR
jgi:hypothetical protein